MLTGAERTNWINPDLCMTLLQMSKDARFDCNFLPVPDKRPWEVARNWTIHAARHIKADWLISFDNDQFVYSNPLDIIAAAGKDQHVIGLTYGTARADGGRTQYLLFPSDGNGASDGVFREVDTVGGGVLMIRSTVWQRIPKGPWFRWQHSDSELLDPTPGTCGEDIYFCRLVRQHGFKVWTHTQTLAGHYHTADFTGLARTFAQLNAADPQARAGAVDSQRDGMTRNEGGT